VFNENELLEQKVSEKNNWCKLYGGNARAETISA
jgi:hypothetical protein